MEIRIPISSTAGSPEQTARLALESQDLSQSLTGNALTVKILEGRQGIEFYDHENGKIRMELGGRADFIEEFDAKIDWGQRFLILREA